jgi:hypothetical protein
VTRTREAAWLSCRAAALGLAACGGGADSGAKPAREPLLLSADGWQRLSDDEDPFNSSGDTLCAPLGWKAEGEFFEIETDLCAKATWAQPLRGPVRAGEPLRFVFWHLDLWAAEPYDARLSLHLGGELAWEVVKPIPGEQFIGEILLEAPVDAAAGAPAWLHLDNHGLNSWRVGELSRAEPGDGPT